ncbi:MAG TPA: hypothetical protein VL422_05445, partial [Miltoncostaea sp.]|nr:hypothetical protein [Miltoncostaea sp.]
MTDERALRSAWDAAGPSDEVTARARGLVVAATPAATRLTPARWSQRRRGLIVTAFAVLAMTGAALAVTRPLGGGDDPLVRVTGHPAFALPPSVAAVVRPGTVHHAVTADG